MGDSMQIKSNDRILVVAPHPDDESIGMGGFLLLYGKQCDVLLITDGRHCDTSTNFNTDDIVKIRKRELTNALSIAGVTNILYLNIEDRKVIDNLSLVKRFDINKYSVIFVPNRNETHVDHCVLYSVFKKKVTKKQRLYEYEVWTPLSKVTDYIDITNVATLKKEMISSHISQLRDCNYVSKALSLNCYRGMYSHFEYAEAFCEYKVGLKEFILHNFSNGNIQKIKHFLNRFKAGE